MQSSVLLYAEGSADFINYDGYRLFLRADKDQQIKAFARGGEFLNFGSSHLGIEEGFISVYRPNGTLYAVYDGSNGTAGIIHNNIEEVNGPVGGAGYNPEVIEVDPADEGVWTFVFSYPTNTGAEYTNLLNDAPWTREADQPTNRRVILAWDVTVSENAAGPQGGDLKTGRVFTNEYNSMISGNGITTSPMFYILTPDGLQYEVVFNETDPWGFPITSSSLGLSDHTGQPTYQSWTESQVTRSDDPSTWTEGNIYQYEPQAQDNGNLINNKIFFNMPDTSMPGFALTTDVFRNNTYADWLYKEPFVFEIIFNDFTINASDEEGETCNVPGLQYNTGAYFVFDSNTPGNVALEMDINNDGDLDDAVDRVIVGFIEAGVDSLFWDGADGEGNPIPVQDQFTFGYQFYLRGGENHITLSDVENNIGGVTFELLSEVGAVDTDIFYYDHSNVAGGVSGGGTAGNPLPTNVPFTYDNQYGNKKMLDYWSYVVYGDNGGGLLSVDILEDCTVYVAPDTDGDGLTDDIDIDDDNDGISDMREYCNDDSFACLPGGLDPSGDEDGDGIRNYFDSDDPAFTNPCPDANANGICDSNDAIYDTDGDNIPDHLDLDSDNDGISDLEEAKHGALDADKDGVIDGDPAAFGENGLFNELATDANDLTAVINYTVSDKDNDGVIDADDLDSDNDGINDVREAGNYDDFDNDGMVNNSPITVDMNGVANALNEVLEEAVDSDGDGVKDFRDLDSDNDTFLDVGESGFPDDDNDGIVGTGAPFVDPFGRVQTEEDGLLATSEPLDIDGDGIPNYLDLDSDNDAINDVIEYWANISNNNDPDNDGIGGYGLTTVDEDGILTEDPEGNPIESGSNPADTDEDNQPDVWDLDSDNDGVNDVEEGGGATDFDTNGTVGVGMPLINTHGQAIDEDGALIADSMPFDSDEDTYPNYLDLDSDNDGINDVAEADLPDPDNDGIYGTGTPETDEEGQTAANETFHAIPDTDSDGLSDYIDLDSDNDGINDVEEAGLNDEDNDGIIAEGVPMVNSNGQAVDSGLLTTSFPQDTDNDGVEDYTDLDADNDGINDVEEAGHTDTDNDGMVGAGVSPVDENGQVVDPVSGDIISLSFPPDADGDEIPNYHDLDSDNDGINDVAEALLSDPDEDGVIGSGTPEVNDKGQAIDPDSGTVLSLSDPNDADGDELPNYLDLDSDNDGINDVEEAGLNDPDNDGVIAEGVPTVNENGQAVDPDLQTTSSPQDTHGDTVPDYLDLDADNDGINDVEEAGHNDPDNNGTAGTGVTPINELGQVVDPITDVILSTSLPPDTDGDNVPNYHDLDSDNDGINDVEEGGNADPDNDGIINTGMPEVNENGQAEGATSFPDDADEDTYPNYLDLDSDNDGINDVEEAGHPDADNDGVIGTGTPVVNEDGQAAATGSPDTTSDPQDTDGDEVPDYLDLDSDNDGINDVEEGGNEDPDNDGVIGTGLPEVNEDGQAVSPTGDVLTGSNPQDTDGDNVPDYHDLDSDNDGINDVTEAGHDDPDFDGVAGTGMPQVNEDGQPEVGNTPISISNPLDSDGDEIPDYQDLDSDNDGINDVEEAGNLDPDNDGIVGVGMPPVDENGLTDPENPELPIDTDEDGTPDYLDLDSDDDGISDVIEAGFLDPDDDGVVGTGTPVVNGNGQPNGSTSDPTDTDGDGIPDYQELDSDDDGLPDEGECPDDNTCLDWDEDGIPDFQDVDSDNDGIPDETECETGFECPDTDGDGIPDYHDLDTDGDGIPDEEECPNGNDCPDSDGDGIPDWRDPACNGATDLEITNLTGEGTYCTGEDIVLTATPDIDFSEPVSFTWNGPLGAFNGTATSAADLTYTIPTVQTSAEGFYSLTVLTDDGCGGTSNSIFINVIVTPATPSLSTANTMICAGDDLVLQASPAAGENPIYQWYADGQLVTETTSPTLTIFGASALAGGVYTVQIADGICPSLPSNEVEITIVEPIEDITATNPTTETAPACYGTNVLLSVPFYEGASYQWFGPNGEVGTGFAVGLEDVNPADAGAYYAIITFAECGTTTSSFTNVFVADETVIPVLTSDNDEICEGESVTLSIINDLGISPEDAVTFTWINLLNGETVAETTEPELTLENLSQAGDYVVTFTINGCEESSESYFITVNETPDEEATIPNDVVVLCDNEAAILEAIAPNEGSGRWTSLGEATILSADNNVTQAVNLTEGENIFVWTLSTDACPAYSTDTLSVYTASAFAVNDDIFEIQQNTELEAADVVSNDDLFNLEAYTISVIEEPNSGVVTLGEDGLFDFSPETDFTGVVTFMYEVCKIDCPDDCLAATVTIVISEDEPSGECFVPNGITPNGDDKNDFLEIPCLEGNQFPQNNIMIFNRWGDKVYETVNYQNDWGGTFRGRQLPAGTYFYILQVEPNSTPIQDFFTIVY